MSNRKLIDLTNQRIDCFERFMEPRYRQMRDWYRLYTGEYFCKNDSFESSLYYDVKLLYTIVNNFIPAIVLADPDIIVKPRKNVSVDQIELIEKVSNYYWRELNIKDELKKVVQDTMIFGFGVMKTGWHTKLKSRNKKVDIDSPGGEKTFNVSEYIQADSPLMHRVSPYLFMWDPQARTIDRARWVGEKLIRPIEEVVNNKAYNTKAVNQIQATNFGMQDYIFSEDGQSNLIEEDPDRYVLLYEIHDRERDLLITLAHGVEEPLRVIPYPYKNLEGTHYGMLVYNPLPDKVLGLSLPELLKDQQIALNRARTLQANHAKRAARIYGVNVQSGIKREDVEALQRATDGSVIFTNDDPGHIKSIEHAALPRELFEIADIARSDMFQVSGTPPHRIGMPAGGRTTATEIQSMNADEQVRLEDVRAETEDFSAMMTKKMIQIMANKLSDEKVVMIVGEDKFVPFTFTREDLRGEFDFTIDAGSMSRQSREVERQQLMQFLNMAAQVPGVNPLEIVKRIAKTFGWKQLDKIFAPPQPQQQGQVLDTAMQNQNTPPDQASILANLTQAFNREGSK